MIAHHRLLQTRGHQAIIPAMSAQKLLQRTRINPRLIGYRLRALTRQVEMLPTHVTLRVLRRLERLARL
jgi:hypothetical protein